MTSENKRHYILNIISYYGSTIAAGVIGMISAPISLDYWKPELFGVWAIVNSLAVYLSVSGLGVDVAVGILMTKTGSAREKIAILRRGLQLVMSFMAAAALILVLFAHVVPDWVRLFGNMSEATFPVAKATASIFVASFLVNLPFSTISNCFAAYGKAYLNNVFGFANNILQFGVLLCIVLNKRTMVEYAIGSAVATLLLNTVKVLVFCSIVRLYGEESEEFSNEASSYRNILVTGMRLSLYGIAVMVGSSVGNLIISNALNISKIAPYSMASRIVSLLMAVVMTMNNSMSPIFGKEYARGNWDWIKSVHGNLFSSTTVLAGLLCYGCMFFLRDVIFVWVGREVDPGILLVVFISFWAFTYCMSNLNYVIVNSLNYTKGIVLISWSELAIFAVSAWFLTKAIGVAGVPAGMFLGSLLSTQWALPRLVHRRSGDRLAYDRRLLTGIVALVLAAVPVMYVQQRFVAQWYWRLAIGIACVGLYILFTFGYLPETIRSKLHLSNRRSEFSAADKN